MAARTPPASPRCELGDGPLGRALRSAYEPGERVLWVPDGELHGVPIQAVRLGGRYLIEAHEVVHSFSGALLVHQARRPRRRWRGRLALIVAGLRVIDTLRFAPLEGRGVASAFAWNWMPACARRRGGRPSGGGCRTPVSSTSPAMPT